MKDEILQAYDIIVSSPRPLIFVSSPDLCLFTSSLSLCLIFVSLHHLCLFTSSLSLYLISVSPPHHCLLIAALFCLHNCVSRPLAVNPYAALGQVRKGACQCLITTFGPTRREVILWISQTLTCVHVPAHSSDMCLCARIQQ